MLARRGGAAIPASGGGPTKAQRVGTPVAR